jgi:hypothetical protein
VSDGLSQHAPQPPLANGSGGSGAGTATGTWAEDGRAHDALGPLLISNAENATAHDALAFQLVANPENATVDDALRATVIATYAEDAQVNDLMKLQLLNVDVARSATPDTDPVADGWTDQAATGVVHGNESLIVKGKSTVGTDERLAHLLIDLSQYTSWTAGGTGLTLTIKASNAGAVLAETITWSAQDTAARSFTESTLTWTNQPATAATRGTGTFSVPAGGAVGTYALTITPANLTACLGRWLLITFSAASTALPNTVTVLSRDNATAGNRPTYTADYLQRGT